MSPSVNATPVTDVTVACPACDQKFSGASPLLAVMQMFSHVRRNRAGDAKHADAWHAIQAELRKIPAGGKS